MNNALIAAELVRDKSVLKAIGQLIADSIALHYSIENFHASDD